MEYSLFTYLYVKTVDIIHSKSVCPTEIIDSGKDLQTILAAVWWRGVEGKDWILPSYQVSLHRATRGGNSTL